MHKEHASEGGSSLFNWQTFFFLLCVIAISFLTYFNNYWLPARVFWDENYHIASAQKYLNGVFFQEQHPPLGKLLIALGEKLLHPNARTDQFISTDYATDFSNEFSFAGYRLFSALLGWWSAPLLFLIFLLLTRRSPFAFLLSFLYVFDNALIVHLRGAMIEGPLMFFSVLMILAFFLVLEWRERPRLFLLGSLLFGASFGCVLTTKLVGLALILLLPALLYALLPDWRKIVRATGFFLLGFLVLYCGIWQIHFSLATRVNPILSNGGYYHASDAYKSILAEGKTSSPLAFPTMLWDSIEYVSYYSKGVPRLDLCKPDENGSPPYLWPLGARTISYRWETPDGQSYEYLYLQSNPVVWLASFAAVLIAAALLLASILLPLREKLRYRYLLTVFVGCYAGYMIAVSLIGRVMYLYHYFTPLLLSFIILGILTVEISQIAGRALSDFLKTWILGIFGTIIFLVFFFYAPLTYYKPITNEQFKLRALLPVWELTCVNCTKFSPTVVPRSCPAP